MKFSILIPVYNVEIYLERCLDSILQQRIDDYEVILVNDGSTDNSKTICEKYVQKDNRFRLVNQKNRGLLIARRTALKLAKGDYILFLDSDDFWESNLLEELVNAIGRSEPDVIIYGFNNYEEFTQRKEEELIFDNGTLFDQNNKDYYIKAWICNPNLNAIWSKAVKRQCIDYWNGYEEFEGLSSGEDYIQSVYIIDNASSILYLGKALYNYRKNDNSISHVFNPNKISEFFVARMFFWAYIKEKWSHSSEIIDSFWRVFYIWLIRNLEQLYETGDRKAILKWNESVVNNELYKEAQRYYSQHWFRLCYHERLILYLLTKNIPCICIVTGKIFKLAKNIKAWMKA